MLYRNLMITMLLGGLWHGAALNFVAWGVFHGAILVIHRMVARPLKSFAEKLPLSATAIHWIAVFGFFHITCFGWLLFFAQRLSHVKVLVLNLFKAVEPVNMALAWTVVLFGGLTMVLELLRERHATDEEPLIASRPGRLVAYCGAVALLCLCGVFRSSEFIYFQF